MSEKGIVCKFGGTSLADANQIRKVVDIVKADPRRRHVVVSAPGKRFPGDEKVTDLLYAWYHGRNDPSVVEGVHQRLIERYAAITSGLGQRDVREALLKIRKQLHHYDTPDYVASRGEYLNAVIVAHELGADFFDAIFIRFDARDRLDMAATEAAAQRLGLANSPRLVIPGFYGHRPDGSIKTFSRGGSDLSGAVVAAVTDAEVYENWTDVDGIRMAHPGIVPDARKVDVISFREIRELSYMGADVLHEQVVFPLYKKGIPIHVRNTNRPADAGSMVVPDDDGAPRSNAGSIVGVAGRRGFTMIRMEKMLMNSEIGFIGRACDVFTHHQVSLECIPGGLDSICIAVDSAAVKGKLDAIVLELQEECRPDSIQVIPEIALICTVGNAMVHAKGVAAKVFEAVRDANVNVSTITQCASEKSIIIGVENADCEKAIAAIYRAFV